MRLLANQTVSMSMTVMKDYAEKIKQRILESVPRDTGALERPTTWEIKNTNKHEIKVQIRKEARRYKHGRRQRVTRYAKYMNDGIDGKKYKLGPKSIQKNNGSPDYGGMGKYVGWLFTQRAANHYRLPVLQSMRKEIGKGLR